MESKLISIGEAALRLGVSIDTLRRWDESGKLKATRKSPGGRRYYNEKDIEVFSSDLFKLASDWVNNGTEFPGIFYCATSSIFQAKLVKMERLLIQKPGFEKLYSLIVLIAGEIGDNSFAHNLGKWPDTPGIFFAYDVQEGVIVLADRGLGILNTLSRVRPELSSHAAAVEMAFTQFISGRNPEFGQKRGNGLKLVREVVTAQPIDLFFTSGNAEVSMKGPDKVFRVTQGKGMISGCMAKIEF